MDKTTLGGKPYNTLGSSDSNLILKTKGDLKIQWGNKFIDLIKNGKIASNSPELLKSVQSPDQITSSGIYLVTDSGEIWICIDGTKINLQSEDNSSYVSFLVDQKEITPEQKNRALKNIGFYYNSLTEAQSANITAGLIYVEQDQKLYIVNNKQISEYQIVSNSPSTSIFEEITVGNLRIYKENNKSIINSPNLSLIINNKEYLNIDNDFLLSSNFNISDSMFIQSYGANSSRGFRLYSINGKSFLEVDNIIERSSSNYSTTLNKFDINSQHNNIILGAIQESGYTKCKLKYKNQFQKGQDVYIYLEDTIYLNIYYKEDTIELYSSSPVPEQIQVQVTVNNESQIIVTIEKNQYYGNIQVGSTITSISNYIVIKGSELVSFSENSINKRVPYKYNIQSIENDYIIINVSDNDFLTKCVNVLVCLASESYIKTEDNNMSLIEGEQVNTQIGIINESEIESLKNCPEQLESPKTGIYSNNFIGLNSKLYDAVFKKRCTYPKYDSITIPDKPNDEQYNQVVPNIAWIKELLKYAVPSGTIVMHNGKSPIPEGWVICDGNNGTPNLVGKFIKAVSSSSNVGENSTDLSSENKLTIKEENLPAHNHPHASHSHSVNQSITSGTSGSLSMSSSDTFAYSLQKTAVISEVTGIEGLNTSTTEVYNDVTWKVVNTSGGSHSHNVSVGTTTSYSTSNESSKTWTNKAIKVEPHSYSLIFIMKL